MWIKPTAIALLLLHRCTEMVDGAPDECTAEFPVNPPDGASKTFEKAPRVGTAANGNTVIVYQRGSSVFVQRYNPCDTSPIAGTSEIQANDAPSGTAGLQSNVDIAMHPSGNEFAIAWHQYGTKVFVKRFDFSTGLAIGAEVEVDATEPECLQYTRTDGCFLYHGYPRVAYYNSGLVMVAYGGQLWHVGIFVFLKVVDTVTGEKSDRLRVGPTPNYPPIVNIASDATGNAICSWEGPISNEISFQLFDISGTEIASIGGNKKVGLSGEAKEPAVAMNSEGFVLAWFASQEIYGQRFDSSGSAEGSRFQVNDFTTNNQAFPSVAMNADGRFVIAWNSFRQVDNSDSWYDVYFQAYKASGAKDGGETQVNDYTYRHQRYPSVGMSADKFVVSWYDEEREDDVWGRWYVLPQPGQYCASLPSADRCAEELAALCTVTDGASSLDGKDKDGFLGKVANAVVKVNESKYRDALRKLSDFDAELRSLKKEEGEIDESEAESIQVGLKNAVACVRTQKQRIRR